MVKSGYRWGEKTAQLLSGNSEKACGCLRLRAKVAGECRTPVKDIDEMARKVGGDMRW